MGLRLDLSSIYIPQFIGKKKLEMLFDSTAAAFQATAPDTSGISYEDCLKLYAQFTREQADAAIQKGNSLEIQFRLFQNAYQIGQQFKEEFKIHNAREIMKAGALIYWLLKIDFRGEPQGNIIIRRCFFSKYYAGNTCRLISALDAGLLVGLAGGGQLTFSQRITEGHDCCRAFLDLERRPI
jgi:hypothetical protein